MICESCGQERAIAARGLCRTCYSRWQRGGTVDYIRPLKDRTCSVEGCNNRVHGQGLCNKHLLRLRRTGTVEEGRQYTHLLRDPGNLPTTHDLYPIWAEFKRTNNPRPVVPEWLVFETFVHDVVARPGRRFRIYGLDRSKPLGPGNYEWKESSIEKMPGESKEEYARRQSKAHRAMYPANYKDAALRRNFGPDFGFDNYADMHEAQEGLCAIRGEHETALSTVGKPRDLCVDHDHSTLKVRQLLTTLSNTLLGAAEDDPMILAKAILYLGKHADTPEQGQAMVDQAIAYLQRHPVSTLDRSAILPQE